MTDGASSIDLPGPRIDDDINQRLRHPRDLLGMILCVVGIAVVLVLAVFAHGTTTGIASDVQGFSSTLARLLFLPVAVLEALIMLGVPVAVLLELSLRKAGRQAVDAMIAAVLALGLAAASAWTLTRFGSDQMIEGVSVLVRGSAQVTMPIYISGIVALLTVAGPSTRRRSVRWSWNLLWTSLAIVLITGQVSIPGVALVLLLGRIAGSGVRYLFGVRNERAYGQALLEALRQVGIEPLTLARVRDVADDRHAASPIKGHLLDTYVAHSAYASLPNAGESVLDHPPTTATGVLVATATDPASVTIARYSDNRVYALTTKDGPRLDVVVLDGDRQVIGFLTRLWRSLRLRGIEGRSSVSLRAVAERAALLAYTAEAAGVRTLRLRGISAAEDSMLLIQEHASGAVSWRDLPDEAITDAVLAELWHQISLAHDHGLSHRRLTEDVVLVRADHADKPQVWLTGWESGDVASSELSHRMDLAQLLSLVALRVGPQRAVASATAAGIDAGSVGPILQVPTLPRSTREQLRARRDLLPALRAELVNQLPETDVEPIQMVRLGARSIIMSVLTVVALIVVVTTVNFNEIKDSLGNANPWWMVVSFALGLLTWLGGAMTFVAFAPVKVPLQRAFLMQAASSFVALAAPAGIGPAALNLRMLTRRGVHTTLAVATVALVQLSQIVVTVVLLVVLSVVTGDGGVLRSLPSTPVLAAIGGLALLLAVALTVPTVRRWVTAKIGPMLRQVWPRLSAVLAHPWRLAGGLAGSAVMALGYVLAFDAALTAFGQSISLVDAAVIYLVGNAVGAAVPTPGGVGPIELALVTGLTTTAGVSASVATSAVVLFRVVTYWARIPLGWAAMQHLKRQGEF